MLLQDMKTDETTGYPHPCVGCPYKFGQVESSCTLTGNYPNCAWWVYKKMIGIDPYPVQVEIKRCIARIKEYKYNKEGEVIHSSKL